ncbi:helix-turn-helix transcriptional regulator [Micromonospora chalcea]|uniref:helix-turn-helix transcriptional regulator n=1 Tax=Micromonospora chalcea TaxID=1874 RepID=UPI002168F01A|nr:helix-turn-helix domain-containing protein [Micromonospora chalcea]
MIDPQRVDDAKRALGARLAAWRNVRGLTQLALARRVPVSRTTIAGVERGQQCPDRIFWQRCEAALAAGGELLADYDDYRRLKQQLDQEKVEAAQRMRWGEVEDRSLPAGTHGVPVTDPARESLRDLAATDLTAGGPNGLTAPLARVAGAAVAGETDFHDGDAVTLAVMSDGRAMSLRVSRRALLELAAGLTAVPVVTTTGVSHPRSVDPAVVDHFAELRALLVQADDLLGGLTILSTVEQQIALIAALRRQTRGQLRNRLLSTEARWSEFAGWLSDDLGDRAAGDRWLDRAGSMAQEADDQEFWAYVLTRKAQRMVGTGDEDCVVGLARAASRLPDTPRSCTPSPPSSRRTAAPSRRTPPLSRPRSSVPTHSWRPPGRRAGEAVPSVRSAPGRTLRRRRARDGSASTNRVGPSTASPTPSTRGPTATDANGACTSPARRTPTWRLRNQARPPPSRLKR